MSNLKLNGNSGKYDVLNFNSDAFVDFSTEVILSGLTEPVSFYMYLDLINYPTIALVIYNSPTTDTITHNIFIVFLRDNYLWVQTGEGVTEAKKVDITNFANQTVFVQIKRTDNISSGAADVTYVKFNGVEQTLNSVDVWIGIFQEFNLGTLYQSISEQYFFKLYNATIWNLTIPGRNSWKGYVGNTDTAWVDQIGTVNGSVSGTTKTNRTVSIPQNKKVRLGSGTSKLKIKPLPSFPTVSIGSQTWMLYNANVNIVGSRVYGDDENNRLLFGGLYTYDTLGDVENAYPGFRVPTLADYHTLSDFLGGDSGSGKKLKEIGTTYWNVGGDNTSGFGARAGGLYNGSYLALKSDGYYLTTSPSTCIALYDGYDGTTFTGYNNTFFLSVRLIKN